MVKNHKLASFYSTYEELKLRKNEEIKRRKNGFYSTYEELKQYRKDGLHTKWAKFLQYLWGIETSQ